MADQQTNPAPADAPEQEVEEQAQPTAPETPETEGDQPAEGEATETPEELEEIEHDGKRYQIPKPLKAGIMMQRDYTQKTQEVAEQRRAVEAERLAVAETAKLAESYADQIANLRLIDQQLAAFQNVNWDQINAQDPVEHSRLTRLYMQLSEAKQRGIGELQQRHQQATAAQQQELAKRVRETNEQVAKDIPNWIGDIGPKVEKFAIDSGVGQPELQAMATRPHLVKLMHLAWIGHQAQQKQRQATARPAPAQVQPVVTVGARKATASSEPRDSDNINDWIRKRNKQVGRG